ncbi:hypothetical protein TW65_00158 [Stemphylium lycopersici]|nr:hypothetical protein TW65_00158 [Stemphylium lycopersici]
MPVNWNDKDVLERLFIATLASLDNKININEVTRIYGKDMTYHALENHLRVWKKQATVLKNAATSCEGAAESSARPRAKKADPSPKSAVKSGRIARKKAPTTTKVKSEALLEGIDEVLSAGDEYGAAMSSKESESLDHFV